MTEKLHESQDDAFERFTGATPSRLTDRLADFAPDVARYIRSFVFGEVYARAGLSDKEKAIAVITTLAASASFTRTSTRRSMSALHPSASSIPSFRCSRMRASRAYSMRSLKRRPFLPSAALHYACLATPIRTEVLGQPHLRC